MKWYKQNDLGPLLAVFTNYRGLRTGLYYPHQLFLANITGLRRTWLYWSSVCDASGYPMCFCAWYHHCRSSDVCIGGLLSLFWAVLLLNLARIYYSLPWMFPLCCLYPVEHGHMRTIRCHRRWASIYIRDHGNFSESRNWERLKLMEISQYELASAPSIWILIMVFA